MNSKTIITYSFGVICLAMNTLTWGAVQDFFRIHIENWNFPEGIKMKCGDQTMFIPVQQKTVVPPKFFYNRTTYLHPVCRFYVGSTSLGTVNFRLVLNRKDGDVVSGYIQDNNLKKEHSEILQTSKNIYINFKDQSAW